MAIRTANNQSLTEITSLPSVVTTGSMVLLETKTASGDSTLSFTSNIDSTYDEYVFKFIDIHSSAGLMVSAKTINLRSNVKNYFINKLF